MRDRPSTPPSLNTKGFRLPRFSLWGRSTPDTLQSDVDINLSPPSNVVVDLNKLHIGKQRAYSLQSSTYGERLALGPQVSSESISLSTHPSVAAETMPALAITQTVEPNPKSSPRLGQIWRLRGGLFATSNSTDEAQASQRTARPQTADPSTPRDATHLPPASQFAAWSELLHGPAPPNRSNTFSSLSSASCNSVTSPNMKKVRSQDSIRSAISSRPSELDPSSSYSSVPVPRAIKTKLRSKSKASKEADFEKIFLAQELHASSSSSQAASIGRIGSDLLSPSLVQTEFFASPAQEGRRKRASWAPRRSASPAKAPIDRQSADLAGDATTRSSVEHQDGQERSSQDRVRPGRIDRQLSTSSNVTMASSTTSASASGSDAVPSRSPRLSSAGHVGDLDQPNDPRTKRSKSATPKRKTYALQFSLDGRYLATAGSDHLIRVYEVVSSPLERAEEIDLAQLHRAEREACHRKLSSACSQAPCAAVLSNVKDLRDATPELAPVFKATPVRIFAGHAGDVMDLSWSKNNFLLSCSSDKTAKLWHPNRTDCLCTFSTSAIVSSIDFHPTDDRFFVTGGLDGKLRLWNIAARRVQSINDVPGVITAVAFSASGRVVCVGTHSGSMLTFSCDHALAYVNTVTVKSAAANKSTPASKITSIQPIKLGSSDAVSRAAADDASSTAEYMTITSNDSRIRIYSIASRCLVSRFKSASYLNRSSQIRATTSSDSQFIISGSEDASIHVWSLASNASLLASVLPSSLLKRNKSIKPAKGSPDVGDNSTWRSWNAGTGSVRCAIFAPDATCELLAMADDPLQRTPAPLKSRIIVSTDDSNSLKVWRTDPQGRLI